MTMIQSPPRPVLVPPPAPRQLDANQVSDLYQQGFSSGLIRAIAVNANRFPLRLWVIDNSSSMQQRDAHVIRGSTLQPNLQTIDCTRWQEAQESVDYFCHMAVSLSLPTRFTMLNDLGRLFGPPTFSIGETTTTSTAATSLAQDLANAQSILQRAYPSGATPLTQHVLQIRTLIAAMAPQLKQRGQVISVVLATDGLPSDELGNEGEVILNKFVEALRSLEGLPVWVVVRLCTDDEKVFDFYNSIDAQMDLPYDVLDDFFGEALEVYLQNPWLTYALPLHRFRELGFFVRALDVMDEHALTYQELRELCCVLFQHGNTLPDPAAGDWLTFLRALANLMSRERWQFNSIAKTLCPWIDLKRLHLVYGRNIPFPHELQQPIPIPQPQPPQAPNPHTPQYAMPPPQQQQQKGFNQFAQHEQAQVPPQAPSPHTPQYAMPPPQQQQQQQGANQFAQHQQAQVPPQSRPPQPSGGSNFFPQQSSQVPPHDMHGQTPPQPQAAPPPAPPPSCAGPAPISKYQTSESSSDLTQLKHSILTWAVLGPNNMLKPINQLLATVHTTFPPAFDGVLPHAYFQKWKRPSPDALQQRTKTVIKRAVRKLKFFLHPDKLPRDFTKDQTFLCKLLWDITADSMEEYEKQQE